MDVLVPNQITTARLISSTAAEPGPGDGTAWSATASYAKDDVVYLPSTHQRYRAAVANTNVPPEGALTTWVHLGPTNRWAALDDQVNTQTVVDSPLTMVLRPGAFTSITLMEMDADSIDIVVRDKPGGVVVYEYSRRLEGSRPSNWWDYFFMPFRPMRDLVLSGIPSYLGSEIEITLTSAGQVRLGMLALGEARRLGCAQQRGRASFKDYSYVSEDPFGRSTIMKRPNAKNASLVVWVKREDADAVMDTLSDVLGVPCMWIATELPGYNGLRIFGLGSGEMSYDHPNDFFLTLNIKGLI